MRIDSTPFIHWTQRHLIDKPVISVGTMRLIAQTMEDGAKLELFKRLLNKTLTPSVGKVLDSELTRILNEFKLQTGPEYTFMPCGPKSKDEKKKKKGSASKVLPRGTEDNPNPGKKFPKKKAKGAA